MKYTLSMMFLMLWLVPALAQQANPPPNDNQVIQAFKTCKQHRIINPGNNPKYVPTPDPRNKNWYTGWEFCSDIQDAYEAIEQRMATQQQQSEQDAAKSIASGLPKK
jgi:hypothetical protein